MATAAQIAANRRNAQRSTGPRTAAGKARISQNAKQKHGFRSTLTAIPDYDAPLFRPRLLGLRQEFQPEGRVENALVCALAIAMWRIVVFENQEADFLNSHPDRIDQVRGVCTIGRYRDRAECEFFRLLRFVRRYFFTIKPNSARNESIAHPSAPRPHIFSQTNPIPVSLNR